MEIHPVGAELLHADGQTDMTKLIVTVFFFLITILQTHVKISCYIGAVAVK